LASVSEPRARVDAGGLEAGVRACTPGDPSFQPRGAICSDAYVDLLNSRDVEISMASVGGLRENGYDERFMRTIKEEEVDLSEYENLADAWR